jgi:hypothetical protein
MGSWSTEKTMVDDERRAVPVSGIGSRSSGSGSSRHINPWLSDRLSAYFLVFDSKTCYAFDHPARFTIVE